MLTNGSLLLEEIDGEPLIFLPHLRKAEEGIAARIKCLAGMATLYPPIDFDKDVFNGDVGIVERVDPLEQQVAIRFDERVVKYDFGELDEVSLPYAVTMHKSQGSEFPAIVIPLATQHYVLLQRNLIYTGITRGKRLLVLMGQKKALGIAVRNDRPQRRYSGLLASLRGFEQRVVP
jgi:exodeoxyribonuclease V alpha subunit